MYRPKGGWNLPTGKVVGRAKPVKKCRKCVKPMVAKGLCTRHYQAQRRTLQMRVQRRESRRDYALWVLSVYGKRKVRLLGLWVNTLWQDHACKGCGSPTVWGLCTLC